MEEKKVCPYCGYQATQGNFCPECGSPYTQTNNQTVQWPTNDSLPVENTEPKIRVDRPNLSDKGLKMIVDYCRKTVGTVGGNGHDEIVLYYDEKNDNYQIHTYKQFEYMPREIHVGHYCKEDTYERVFKLIDEYKLIDYVGQKGFGMCGGLYVCKFLKDGQIYRVTTENMPGGGANKLITIGNLLKECIID